MLLMSTQTMAAIIIVVIMTRVDNTRDNTLDINNYRHLCIA